MKKVFILAAASAFGLLVNSCKTDFETIAPYNEMVCVYGMLEHQQNTNYIRINRVFLTEENAYQTAQNNDSVNYAPGELTVALEKYRDGTLINTFALTETVTTLQGSGDFNTSQRLWVCNNQLASFGTGGTENSNEIKYKLKIHNNKTGKDFYADTKMVKDQNPIQGVLTNTSVNMTNPTNAVKMKWYSPRYGKVNNLIIRFYYQEFATNDTTVYVDKFVDWNLGNQVVTNINSDLNEISYSFMGDQFYNTIANLIPADPGIWGRKARGIVAILTTCGEEFQLYTEVNSPSNTIVQDKPLYTNITDGVGVFSSRSRRNCPLTGYIKLTNPSLDKLAGTSTYPDTPTCGLRFLDAANNLGLGCQ